MVVVESTDPSKRPECSRGPDHGAPAVESEARNLVSGPQRSSADVTGTAPGRDDHLRSHFGESMLSPNESVAHPGTGKIAAPDALDVNLDFPT
jgi:hypothetical protein